MSRDAIQQFTPQDSKWWQIASAVALSLLEWLINTFAAGAESLWVSRATRKAQTGQYGLSSANSEPHAEQALLPSTFATVSSSKLESYSIWSPMARAKIACNEGTPVQEPSRKRKKQHWKKVQKF
jgi:hypothetical protein